MGSHLHMLHLLFPSSQAQNGGNGWSRMTIQTLKMFSSMKGCDEVVEILGAATSEVEEKGSHALIKFHLPKLRVVILGITKFEEHIQQKWSDGL
ncbi:hypothetical protein Gotur_016051 [Gossypium turneri]